MQRRKKKLMELKNELRAGWEEAEYLYISVSAAKEWNGCVSLYQNAREDYQRWLAEYEGLCTKAAGIEKLMCQILNADLGDTRRIAENVDDLGRRIEDYEKTGVLLELIADALMDYFQQIKSK